MEEDVDFIKYPEIDISIKDLGENEEFRYEVTFFSNIFNVHTKDYSLIKNKYRMMAGEGQLYTMASLVNTFHANCIRYTYWNGETRKTTEGKEFYLPNYYGHN